MSYGIQSYGISGFGSSDFIVKDHIPADDSIGINRNPIIQFTLASGDGNIILATINLITNGIQLILNGVFTSNSTGIINSTDPANVIVQANVIHAFSPFTTVNVNVSANNAVMALPTSGTNWKFNVSGNINEYPASILRGFERILLGAGAGLTAPQNPHAIVELLPPILTGMVL